MLARHVPLAVALGLLVACSSATDDTSASPEHAADAPERGQEPFEVVDGELDPDDEVTQGDGWELLDSSRLWSIHGRQAILADHESRLDWAWGVLRMEGDPPAVDFGPRLTLLVTVPSECDFVLRDVSFGEVTADDWGFETGELRLTAQVTEPCADPDATGRTLALALDRDRVDVDRIFASIGDGYPLGEDDF